MTEAVFRFLIKQRLVALLGWVSDAFIYANFFPLYYCRETGALKKSLFINRTQNSVIDISSQHLNKVAKAIKNKIL